MHLQCFPTDIFKLPFMVLLVAHRLICFREKNTPESEWQERLYIQLWTWQISFKQYNREFYCKIHCQTRQKSPPPPPS